MRPETVENLGCSFFAKKSNLLQTNKDSVPKLLGSV